MLRVRPVLSTSRIGPWRDLLTAAGLACVAGHGGARLEFAAGSGRLDLHLADDGDAADGRVELGFEVRDLDEFVRRTVADGTRAEIEEAGHGRSARITAPSGLSFLAQAAAPSLGHVPGHNPPDPGLTVMPVWLTPDVRGAAATLRGIGARPRFSGDAGHRAADFAAKNGGLVAVQHGETEQLGLAFEYDGGLSALWERLATAGHGCSLADETGRPVLLVEHPDGANPAGGGYLRFSAPRNDSAGNRPLPRALRP